MSNALSHVTGWLGWLAEAARATPASAPTTAPAGEPAPFESLTVPPLLLPFIAVGACVLLGWIVLRAMRPGKLYLRGTPGRPNRLTVLHLAVPLLGYLLVQKGAAAALAPWLNPRGLEDGQREARLAAAVVAQVAWLAAALAVSSAAFRGGLRRGLGLSLRRWLADSVRAAAGYLAVLPVCIGLLLAALALLPAGLKKIHDLFVYMRALPGVWQPAIWLSAVVLAPLSEEVYFRGLMQSFIRQQTARPWTAILAAAAFFAAIHAPAFQNVVPLFALAVALGYNYERTGRLLSPILMHAMFNAVNLAAFAAS